MGGNTLDKRHTDFNDELGYIAPPNRKLPPVPGSNYNTCDRIKRGKHCRLQRPTTITITVVSAFVLFAYYFRFFKIICIWFFFLSSLEFCVYFAFNPFYFCSRHFYRSGFPSPYHGHGTWNPRARHMYEELNGSNPRCRGHLPPCPGSDETMYTRCRGKKDDKRTINYY